MKDPRPAMMRAALDRRLATLSTHRERADLLLAVMRELDGPLVTLAELRELLPQFSAATWKATHGPLGLLIAEGRIARIAPGLYRVDPDLTATLTPEHRSPR